MILIEALSSFWWVPQRMVGEEGTPTQPARPAEHTPESNGRCSRLLPSCPSQCPELALSLTQLITEHQLTTLYTKISIYITGVVTVSWLDPGWHSISVLEGFFLVYGMEAIPWWDIKGTHGPNIPGHSLERHSPTGLSKCYTSYDRPQGKAKAESEGSSQKLSFLQPVTNENSCNRKKENMH